MNIGATRTRHAADSATGLNDSDFAALARILKAQSGIYLAPAKKGLVVSRLSRRLRALDLPDLTRYVAHLESPQGADELSQFVSSLTTNVTKFFREEHHFRALETTVLPDLLARAARGARVRLWSAGCSTGQEAYSIAMTILEQLPEAAQHDIRILATDIDPVVLSTASDGIYPQEDLEDLNPHHLRRHVVPVAGRPGFGAMADPVRALVAFAPLNLCGPWPMRGVFDVIFCRNVVIYFDAATQDRLWQRFARIMPEGADLFIGHSERLSAAAGACFSNAGITQYRRTTAPVPSEVS